MISHKYKAVFVHIPKTAGMSVEQVFIDAHGLNWFSREALILGANPHPTMGPERISHLYAEEYVGLGYLEKEKFDQYYKFSFVRNPWDRLVSQYYYRKFDLQMSFTKFVDYAFSISENRSDFARHIVAQYQYLFDSSGNLLVDFVGRYENIRNDFIVVSDNLSLSAKELPKVNMYGDQRWRRLLRLKKKRPGYHSHYNDELRDRVGEFYALDVEHFGYEFERS